MAAIGKIRSWGPILVTVIGLALFAFIAEELFRSCESTRNQERQQIGEVLGKKIDVQEFQRLIDEYTDVIKMTQGRDNLTDQELNQVKDMVWQNYVQQEIIADEAEKLGLTVTDQELQNMLNEGTNPMLLQTPFVNQQTGRFDASALKKFLAEYKKAQQSGGQMAEQYTGIYNYWKFIEKNLRTQSLQQKYQALLAGSILSNPVAAKQSFKDENEESNIQLATFAYSTVNDKDVKISDADLNAKYKELKERFKQLEETRDVKYVDFQVLPSTADRTALNKAINDAAAKLAAAADPTEVVRKANSLVSFLGIPQTKAAFPADIAQQLDSIAVGATSAVKENKGDTTLNVIKLISKQQMPDSVQFRAIQVGGEDVAAAKKTADSIYTALQGGADFEAIAKKYGQTGEKTWLVSNQYQSAPSMDKDTKNYLNTLSTAAVNSLNNVAMTNGNIILQVTDRRAMTTKYVAAVIKKSIDFSKDTYSAAYNKFSQFVSENQTLEAMEKNAAKYGFKVQERQGISNAEHYVVNIPSTREAMKWLFEAKEGTISPLYECGNNDHLLVLALTKVNKKGYLTLDNAQVKEYIRTQVMNDKKAEILMAKAKGVTSIAAAQKKGAKVAPVNQVTFAAPVFIPETGASEPALSGAVAATAAGKFCAAPVKGNAGVYLFQVISKANRAGVKFDAKTAEQSQKQRLMQYAGQFMRDLYQKANVTDNRYLFF